MHFAANGRPRITRGWRVADPPREVRALGGAPFVAFTSKGCGFLPRSQYCEATAPRPTRLISLAAARKPLRSDPGRRRSPSAAHRAKARASPDS